MGSRQIPPEAVLRHFGVTTEAFVVRTALARVWKVRTLAGEAAALKLYHPEGMRNEVHGVDLLSVWEGQGAARLLGKSERAILLEWLDGPSLGDLTRSGEDDRAAVELVAVANRLQAASVPPTLSAGMPDVGAWFQSLFDLRFAADCPAGARQDMGAASALAQDLLASQGTVRPLHGDLHHDNVRLGARGWCAFDAKGVLGERAFELANAFRNPIGADQLVRDPARVARTADLWSVALDVDRQRLVQWAAAKAALSIAWSVDGLLSEHRDLDLLPVLLAAAGRG